MFRNKILRILLISFSLIILNTEMAQPDYINGKPILTGTWKGVTGEYLAGEIQLKREVGADPNQMDSLLSAYECFLIHDFGDSRWGLVGCDTAANIFDKIDGLIESPLVEYAEPNGIIYPALIPNDTYFDSVQWALNTTGNTVWFSIWEFVPSPDADIDGIEAWDLDTGRIDVLVAILDSGIPVDSSNTDSLIHPDLNDPQKYLLGWNFVDSTDNLRDETGHGTANTGILAAMTNNDEGITGVCWGCKILVEVIQKHSSTEWWVASAIRHALEKGAKVMNISAGCWHWASQDLEDAIAEAEDSGCLIAAATGNGGNPDILFPAAFASYGTESSHLNGYRNVIAVANNNWHDEWCCGSSWSNDSMKVTVSAPGAKIFSTLPPYDYFMMTDTTYGCLWGTCEGTSLSSPIVAGLAGLLLSHDLTLTPDEIRTIIENTADDVESPGWDIYTGFGRVNALRALMALEGYYPNATGYLRTNATWGDTLGDTVYVLGDVVIPEGCTLTVDQGAVVRFLTNDREDFGVDSTKCEIIVEGALIVNGTENDSVWFLSNSESPSDFDWYGIRVDPGASAKLTYCNIEHAYTAVNYKNSANDSVTHCRFRNNHMHGLRIENSYVLVDECIIEKDWVGVDSSLGFGILCYQSSPTIKNTFFQGGEYGINVVPSGGRVPPPIPLIEECGFYNIGKSGIHSYRSNPSIRRCCFKGTYGQNCVHVDKQSEPYIKECYMASQYDSIPIGMLFTNSAKGTIRMTTIWDYDSCAVYIDSSCTPDFGNADSIGCNWFEKTDGYYMVADTHFTILAKSNYWDRDDYDTSAIREKIKGDVDIHPVLGKCDHCFPYYSDQCSDLPPSDPLFSPCKIAAEQEEEGKMPRSFSLSQNYPNPFNPQTVIKYDLPQPAHVNMTIYNIVGQKVRTLLDEDQQAGYKTLFWDGRDDKGKDVASGIYFFRLKAGEFQSVKQMVLLR